MPDRKQDEAAWLMWLEDQSAYAEEEWLATQLPAMWLRARARKRREVTVTYKVFVDDNFHFMDEDERYPTGEFETAEAAIAKCIVRASIESCRKRGMTSEEVFSNYCAFGEDPWVVPGVEFSAWTYAKQLTAG